MIFGILRLKLVLETLLRCFVNYAKAMWCNWYDILYNSWFCILYKYLECILYMISFLYNHASVLNVMYMW